MQFKADVKICWEDRCITKKLLVDTGATFTSLARETAEKLGLPIIKRGYKVMGAEEPIEVDLAAAEIVINDRRAPNPIIIYSGIEVIGSLTLETLGYKVDPINGRLIKTDLYPPRI